MAVESFRERNGLQADADFAFYFLDFAEAVGEGGLAGAHAWLECRANVGEGSSGDVRVVLAQHGGAPSPSLKALGMPAVRPSCAPAFHPPPRVARLSQKRSGAPLPVRNAEFKTTLEAVFFQASTYRDDLAKSRTTADPLVAELLSSQP